MTFLDQIKRRWSKAPDKSKFGLPEYYTKSPRLDSVRVIAKHCAGAELKLYSKKDIRKNGKSAEVIEEHELYNLLENPVPTFPEIDGFALRYLTFANVDLCGEFGWLKVREGSRIIALLPIPSPWIMSKPTINDHKYKIMPYGEIGVVCLTVPDTDFILFKDFDLSDIYGNGKGMAESIIDELETDEYASKYQKNFFFNDATPPFVITGFQGNQQSAEQVKKSFMEKIGGFFHAREPAVLTGSMDVKPLGIAPKELDMVESRKFLRDECLQHFQLPPEIFGIIENSNRATIDSSFYLMQKNVLIPRLQFFERVINRQLLKEYDEDLVCRHDMQVIEDEALQLQIYQFGVMNACITREQFCEKFGINPDVKEGTYIVPLSSKIVPVGEEVTENEVELPESEPEDEGEEVELPEDEEQEEENPEKKNYSKTVKLAMQKVEHEQWKMKIWELFDKKALSKENLFIGAVKKIADKQKADIEKLIKENDGKPVENLIQNYFENKEVGQATKRTLASAWLESMKAGRENAFVVLGKKDVQTINDVTITNEMFDKWVEANGLEKSILMNETTKKELVKKLKQILSESDVSTLSSDELAKRLVEGSKEVFQELSTTRAKMIARTETGTSVNFGQVATYKANNVEKKEWISTLDDRTRESHLQIHGIIKNIDEPFEVESEWGIDNMQFPLDPTATAGNVINCRCTVAPVIF